MALASYDQFTDFPKMDCKIIFSEKAYQKLCNLIKESKQQRCETGVFFMGTEINQKNSNEILIEEYTSDLKKSSGYFSGGAVEDTENSQKMRKICSQQYGFNCMFHFHVHTKPQGSYYDVISDQDLDILKSYATQAHFQYFTKEDFEKILGRIISDREYEDFFIRLQKGRPLFDNLTFEIKKEINKRIVQNRKNDYFAILATPNRSETSIDNYQLSVVYAMPYVNEITGEIETKIYNFSNMYYLMENDVYKIGSFERQEAPRLSTGRQIHNVRIPIQAIGTDPKTGRTITDEKVGSYENGDINFNQGSIRR